MAVEKGNLSINSDNIFPIIKKWLYSDHDIFIRELVSNGCDAITKLKKLALMGDYKIPEDNEFKVKVNTDSNLKTIEFIDNGIGMTEDEVKQYINQIAFSGAKDFLEKYKDKANEDQIIGHFGLGFYSAFMVAHKVTIDTLSYKEGAKAVHWESDEGTTFEMSEGDRTERGTKIVLYLNEDSYEFSNEYRVKEVIEKYCSFMPTDIFYTNLDTVEADKKKAIEDLEKKQKEATEKAAEAEKKQEEARVADEAASAAPDDEELKKKAEAAKKEAARTQEKADELKKEAEAGIPAPKPLNDKNPLWTKTPKDCKEEEYKDFYRKVFHDYKEPLFWIHLNMDYPFNLKGILYFPKINMEYESIEGKIKLFNNQVFVADNIKEVIPEFLLLLKGVIDCPDLPLNVSRSALQNDGFAKKISDYITKKVAEKLTGLYKVDKENYEKYWEDISPFVKYGVLKDDKFAKKVKEALIFRTINGKFVSEEEYLKEAYGEDWDKEEEKKDDAASTDSANAANTANAAPEKDNRKIIYYVTDEVQQSQYINMFKAQNLDAVVLTNKIDQPFISKLEQDNNKVRFQRIDADVTETFKEEETEADKEAAKKENDELTALFRKVLSKDKLDVKVEKLKDASISSIVTLSEDNRRMQDMMKMYSMGSGGMDDMFPEQITLTLNANNDLVKYVYDNQEAENTEIFVKQLYDLALISQRQLTPAEMTEFVTRSNKIMQLLSKKN